MSSPSVKCVWPYGLGSPLLCLVLILVVQVGAAACVYGIWNSQLAYCHIYHWVIPALVGFQLVVSFQWEQKKKFLPSKDITHQILQMLSHRSWEQLQQPQWRSPLHAADPACRAAGHLRKGFCIEKWDKSCKEPRPRTQLDCKVNMWYVCLYLDRCQHVSLSFTAALLVCSVQQPSDVPCVWQPFPGALPDGCVAPWLEGSLLHPALPTDVVKIGWLKHISMAWPPFCFQEVLAL